MSIIHDEMPDVKVGELQIFRLLDRCGVLLQSVRECVTG
jgi:hypothetical protein